MNAYLEALRSTPEFQHEMIRVKKQRPVAPVYDPGNDNTEEWKAKSMMQKGFDLCLTLLGEIDE